MSVNAGVFCLMMIIYHCILKLETGEIVAEDVTLDIRFRERSTKQPDSAALWYGTLIPKAELSMVNNRLFVLDIAGSTSEMLQIHHIHDESEHAIQTIRFNGIGDHPQIDDPPIYESATRICEECKSNFFPPSSIMSGLCPECAHYLYGYDNCDHSIIGSSCEICGWDGSVSEYVRLLR